MFTKQVPKKCNQLCNCTTVSAHRTCYINIYDKHQLNCGKTVLYFKKSNILLLTHWDKFCITCSKAELDFASSYIWTGNEEIQQFGIRKILKVVDCKFVHRTNQCRNILFFSFLWLHVTVRYKAAGQKYILSSWDALRGNMEPLNDRLWCRCGLLLKNEFLYLDRLRLSLQKHERGNSCWELTWNQRSPKQMKLLWGGGGGGGW